MLEPSAEHAAFALPLGLTLATAAVIGRARARRRRERLNRALHELRRPLQALVLAMPHRAGAVGGHLERAIESLAELDRELNGGVVDRAPRVIEPERVVADAVARWRPVAERAGRQIGLRWRANGSRVECDPGAIARVLDNLIGNALEHGDGAIEVEGVVRGSRLRLFVVDGETAVPASAAIRVGAPSRRLAGSTVRWRADPRRGHGLRLVAEFAAEHGGRFAACRHGTGACAVIELPLAGH